MNNTTTFSDVFKDKFLQGFSLSTQNLTLPNILISLAIAFTLKKESPNMIKNPTEDISVG